MTYSTKKLGEIIELHYGKGISKYDRKSDGKYPVYGANGILDHSDKYLIDGDAVIVGRKGSAGEITRVSGKFWPSDVTYYVFGNDKIDIDYLFHALKNLNLQRLAVGVKPGINRNRVYELEIPLPPIGEQRKIVAKLEKVLGKIKEAKKLREEAESAAAALLPAELHKIFSDGKRSTVAKAMADKEGWEEKGLGDVCVVQSGGTPKKGMEKYWVDGNIPWLRSEVCRDGNVNSATLFITKEGLGHSSAKLLRPRTTLIALVGATIGKTGFLTFESTTNQNIAGLYPKNDQELFPEFLFIATRNLYPHFLNIGQGKFKMANLSFVKSLKIPLPPLTEQKKIVERLDALSAKVQTLRQAQAKTASDLTALEQSLLRQAFHLR